ncbi:MAG: hypothetical protein ACSHYA_20150 [Opitutaceae bacterium]
MREPPADMKAELSKWNNGDGIDLENWVSCEGNFSLAVGYAEIFWPEFVLYKDYILRKGFSVDSLEGFEKQCGENRHAIESVMNHLHIADIQHFGCKDASKEKIKRLGNILKEIYEAKLQYEFPEHPCEVSFHQPEDEGELIEYEISFWQKKHKKTGVEPVR